MQEKRNLTDYAIILNERDNVATALVDMPKAEYVLTSPDTAKEITLTETVKAGFKVAISHIHPGQRVYKYGYVIGVSQAEIRPGDCVHVHNMIGCHTPRGSERI